MASNGLLPEQARFPKMVLDRSWVVPGPPLFTVTLPLTWLLLRITPKFPMRFTRPAKRFPAHPFDTSPMMTGKSASKQAEGLVGRGPRHHPAPTDA